MNTYIILACLMTVFGLSQGNPIGAYGYGTPWLSKGPLYFPSAVSTANLVKAAPIPIIRTQVVPIITAPVIQSSYGWNNLGYKSLGWDNLGYKSLGLGNLGYKSLGYDGLGWGGYGSWGGYGGYDGLYGHSKF